MRYVRQHPFVPVPSVWDLAALDQRLAVSSLGLSDGRARCSKGVLEGELSLDDSLALLGPQGRPHGVVRHGRRRADKQGKFTLGVHRYSSDPALAGRDLVVGLRAPSVDVYDPDGTPVATHPRAYGDAPTDTSDPARRLPLPCPGPAARTGSPVGAGMPAALRDHADALAASGDAGPLLRTLRDGAGGGGHGRRGPRRRRPGGGEGGLRGCLGGLRRAGRPVRPRRRVRRKGAVRGGRQGAGGRGGRLPREGLRPRSRPTPRSRRSWPRRRRGSRGPARGCWPTSCPCGSPPSAPDCSGRRASPARGRRGATTSPRSPSRTATRTPTRGRSAPWRGRRTSCSTAGRAGARRARPPARGGSPPGAGRRRASPRPPGPCWP